MLLLNISRKISENTNSLREILQFSRLFLNPIVKKKNSIVTQNALQSFHFSHEIIGKRKTKLIHHVNAWFNYVTDT